MNDQEFESFRHWTLSSVEEVGRRFTRPDEDWLPVLILRTARGGIIASIDLRFYENDESKQRLVKRLSAVIVKSRATAFSLIQMMWRSYAIAPEGERPGPRERALRSGRLRPSEDPLRQETILIHITDDMHAEIWAAVIQRRPDRPPRLGRWEKTDLKIDHMTGRFIEPLRAALQRARASNN